jgi:uncharacterized protein YuzE
MSVAFGNVIFDLVDYDQDVDVLYLSTSGVTPCEREESPEGHILRFDENGVICGITIIGVSRLLDAEDNAKATVTFPEREINLSGVDLVGA